MKYYNLKDIGPVQICKNKRSRSLRATYKPEGHFLVTIPNYVTYDEALRFLNNQKDKIKKIKEKAAAHNEQREKYIPGTIYNTKLNRFSIHYHKEGHSCLKTNCAGEYKLFLPHNVKIENEDIQSHLREIVREIYRIEAKKYLLPRASMFANKHNLPVNRITIKNARSRWGSCSSKRNINLNLNLMRLPDELIDYVILHELAHLKHQNHSREFWKFLGTLIENPKKHDAALKKYSLHYYAT